MLDAAARNLAFEYEQAPFPESNAEPETPIPNIVASVDAAQASARVGIWRASDPQFDLWLRGAVAAPLALRRLALRHWSAGNPRLASIMLATAVAIDPHRPETWLDLGFTLQAADDARQARQALELSLALDPKPSRGWIALALAANQLGDIALAERAYRAALQLYPDLHEAVFGLALIAFDARQYVEAADHFARALELGAKQPLARIGLGQSLFFLGRFGEAAQALSAAIAEGVSEPEIAKRAALAHYLATAGDGDIAAAERRYREIAGEHAETPDAVAMSAFQILSGYGRSDAALEIARARLSDSADDPVKRYLIGAVSGAKCDRAPDDYLIAHFDAFAEHFDRQLIDVLGYRAPQQLMELVGVAGRPLKRALDLGCGTGLAGPLLRPGRTRLVGVDLSTRMLAKAAERNTYDELVEAEMIGYLRRASERFDLVLAADTLVYMGDLAPFFAAAARATNAGALITFNIETCDEAPFKLLPTGRFAHDLGALPQLASPWFRVKTFRRLSLRREGVDSVQGALVVMERRGSRLRTAPNYETPATLAA